MSITDGVPINVTRLIDDGKISTFQVVAIALCALVALLDGIDSQSIAVAAPIIVQQLDLTRAAFGPIFSSGLLGATIGALTFGPLGDRFGRKRMLLIAVLLFGVFTLVTPLSPSYTGLLAIRFAAGLGLGGATPCFLALASELAPSRRRAMVASLIWSAFPLGISLGGFLNSFILAKYGWTAIFWFGGIAPLVVGVVLMLWLPESLRFLIARGQDPASIAGIMRRIIPNAPLGARFVSDEERVEGVAVRNLFSDGRAALTLLLWVPFFTAFGALALTVVWTPVLLTENGISPAQASIVLGIHGLGALIGMALAGRLIEKFGAAVVLIPALVLGAAATSATGYSATSVPTMSVTMALIGLLVGCGASGSIALAALSYPTAIRSTGIGWAMGVGRFGQVLAPLLAGAAIAAGWSNTMLFVAVGIAPLLGAVAILALSARRQMTVPVNEPVGT
jgi:AAHS family 4-hydroxybenzoate transporter-like MFS transporter